jgi:hypothetical protein
MSASEKLKALDKGPGTGGGPPWSKLAAAYPQIVAVVEAAERECDYGSCHVCGYKPGHGHATDCALSALEEALS